MASDSSLGMRGSPHVPDWLRQSGISLALTTYQTNRLFLLGVTPNGQLSGFERIFDRPMGLHVSDNGTRLTMATRYQIRELIDALDDGETYEGYDRVYIPRRAYTTGALDAHDLHCTPDGTIQFVNTRFSCLAEPSDTHSFRPVWTPPFISKVSPEDRCHLNGLAVEDGQPRYATAVSRSDVAAGWRGGRRNGSGIVIDIDTGDVIAEGLTMPHSPRLHNGTLYLINAGTGDLGRIDRSTGTFEPIAFLPGFGRGLAFHENIAIVGLSLPRGDKVFQDLPLGDRLEQKHADPRCGLWMVDLETGATAHWLEFTAIVEELYDVQVLPNTVRPMALGFKTDEIRRFITVEHADRAERFEITLETPTSSDASSSDEQPQAELPSLELPDRVREAQARSTRTPGVPSYPLKAGTMAAGDALRRFRALLPNRLIRQVQEGHLAASASLLGVVATQEEGAVGLAAVRPYADGETVEVVALHVLPPHRGQGLGTALVEHLERLCAQNGRDKIKTEYRSDASHQAVLERIFEKRGWSTPQVNLHLYKVITSDFVTHPALSRRDAPPGTEIVSWADVTDAEKQHLRAQVNDGTVRRALSPFQMDDTLEPAASTALRTAEGVRGWMTTHRVSDDVLQYTALHVDPALRQRGAGRALVVDAVHRQHEATSLSKCLWTVEPQNAPMLAFVDAYLKPVLASHTRRIVVGKRLPVPTSG